VHKKKDQNIMSISPEKTLVRQTFSTSRESEFFRELATQTGYARELWFPGVITKETTAGYPQR
jgi:hypothetical protein